MIAKLMDPERDPDSDLIAQLKVLKREVRCVEMTLILICVE